MLLWKKLGWLLLDCALEELRFALVVIVVLDYQ